MRARSGLRRLAAASLALALGGCGAADGGARYLDDASFRRAELVASLVNPDNGYSRLRLSHYATGAAGDWDALPVFNPPVATFDADGNRRDDERALDVDVAGGSAAERALGEAAFYRYPVQLVPDVAAGAAGTLVSARLADGSVRAALTCASCHARVVDGALVPGLANGAIDLGWGPGRIDVSAPGDAPIAIPDLRAATLEAYLQRDGSVRNDGVVALAIRIETLIVTSHEGAVRPPRQVALALARWLASLAPPPPPAPVAGSAAARGAALFAAGCAGCHAPPTFAGAIVPLAVIGTDPAVGLSSDRGTGGYRVPSLRGVSTRGPLLHDASVADSGDAVQSGAHGARPPVRARPRGRRSRRAAGVPGDAVARRAKIGRVSGNRRLGRRQPAGIGAASFLLCTRVCRLLRSCVSSLLLVAQTAVPVISQTWPRGRQPGYHGESRCGPASMAMVARGFHLRPRLSDAALIETLDRVDDGRVNHATAPAGIVRMAAALRLRAVVRPGFDGAWVRRVLRHGGLVVALGRPRYLPPSEAHTGGHYVAIVGVAARRRAHRQRFVSRRARAGAAAIACRTRPWRRSCGTSPTGSCSPSSAAARRGCAISAASARAALRDARRGGAPAGVERLARLVEVDDQRRVVRRHRLALARLAIDLGPRARAPPAARSPGKWSMRMPKFLWNLPAR